MTSFAAIMKPFEWMKIVDLGGTPDIWKLVEIPLDITIVNLPGLNDDEEVESHHRITFIEGDACDERLLAGSNFQMAFSNSAIEHVGDREYQAAFAKVVQRLSEKYWIQTPSKLFPIEAHNGMPFWWYYPRWLKRYFLKGWSKKLPEWTAMVEGTRVLSKKSMTELFPGSQIKVEKFLGIPKSYTAYKC